MSVILLTVGVMTIVLLTDGVMTVVLLTVGVMTMVLLTVGVMTVGSLTLSLKMKVKDKKIKSRLQTRWKDIIRQYKQILSNLYDMHMCKGLLW